MKNFIKLIAFLLAVLMTFSACTTGGGQTDSSETTGAITTEAPTEAPTTEEPTEQTTEAPKKNEMSAYRASISRSREEVEAMLTLCEEDFVAVETKLQEFNDLALVSDDYETVDAVYVEFEDLFYHLETQISIASVVHYIDTTDEVASSRYLDSYDRYGDIYNEYIEVCKAAYENSPIRDQLFADWTPEDIEELFAYDPESQELRERNEEIQVEINELTGPGTADRTAELYAEMVVNYNKLAKMEGYDNYYDYASVEIYGRDYTKEDIASFRGLILEHFMPNFDLINNRWYNRFSKLDTNNRNDMVDYLYEAFDDQSKNYFEGYIESYGDSTTGQGFMHMLENRNIIFADNVNSHQSAFQTYFTELETPFCLFGHDGQNTSSMVHEMGHYYAALYNPDVMSYDLAETQSQANEMLLLKYLDGEIAPPIFRALRGYSIYNFVAMSIVCVIVDEFEQRVYTAEGVENFTSADFDAIMAEVCEQYGGIDFIKTNITDMNDYWRSVAPHSAVYYVSYAVSMMAALSVLAEAEADEAHAREIYRMLCEEVDENDGFLEAITKAGLPSPFDPETFEKIIEIARK